MVNVRRLPGVLYTHKIKLVLLVTVLLSGVLVMHQLGIVCTNYETKREIDKLCQWFEEGQAMGSLCKPLCRENAIHSITCTPLHSGKELVFTAKWKDTLMVFKSINLVPETAEVETQPTEVRLNNRQLLSDEIPKELKSRLAPLKEDALQKPETYPRHFPLKKHRSQESHFRRRRKEGGELDVRDLSEKQFEAVIRDIIADKLNVTVTNGQVEKLKYLEIKNKFLYSESSQVRKTEKVNVYRLLQSHEYLMSYLFSDQEVFPEILGTCGHFYGVEYLHNPQVNSFFMSDNQEDWSERMRLAIAIMDFVESIETNFPDALHLCDIKMKHFGMTTSGQLKFLDLDSVYTNNVIERLVSSGRPCTTHEDCDIFDCKSTCSAETKQCDNGVANNNLQVICEKVFIGWTMSGKVIIPGLLMSEYTPASLAALLRICSENGRAPVPEDIRQQLYTVLTEMYQILSHKLFA